MLVGGRVSGVLLPRPPRHQGRSNHRVTLRIMNPVGEGALSPPAFRPSFASKYSAAAGPPNGGLRIGQLGSRRNRGAPKSGRAKAPSPTRAAILRIVASSPSAANNGIILECGIRELRKYFSALRAPDDEQTPLRILISTKSTRGHGSRSFPRARGRRITLAEVPDVEWNRLAGLGFDVIWLMGMWERSPESRREFRGDAASFASFQKALPGATMDDVVGSPYSIRRYQPDARIGDWASLDATRDKLHARGLRLMLDFVPNHVALDHPWILEEPEYFIQGSRGGFCARSLVLLPRRNIFRDALHRARQRSLFSAVARRRAAQSFQSCDAIALIADLVESCEAL